MVGKEGIYNYGVKKALVGIIMWGKEGIYNYSG